MKKREADFQVTFNQYIRKKGLRGYFELKQTRGNLLSFSSFEPQQIESLKAAQENGFVHKISDADMRIKPFDSLSCPPLPAFIVVKFHKVFYIVPLDAWIDRQKVVHGLKKSFSEVDIRQMAQFVVEL